LDPDGTSRGNLAIDGSIPVTKWSESTKYSAANFSLASTARYFPTKPRRSLGCVYVLRVVENNASGAIIFPNHFVPGISYLYLRTEYVSYFEQYGFEYIGQGYHPWGGESRIYEAKV
jgi:hypothetical protein